MRAPPLHRAGVVRALSARPPEGHAPGAAPPLVAVELRPPRAGLDAAAGIDAWIDLNHALRRLTGEGRFVFLTDDAVGVGEEESLGHLDANLDPERSGYKSAHFLPARNPHELLLKLKVDRAVLGGTHLTDDDRNVTGNMFRYYAFNPAARHSVNPRTPALLVEMGYISNPADRRFLLDSLAPAQLVAAGIISFLEDRQRLPAGSY